MSNKYYLLTYLQAGWFWFGSLLLGSCSFPSLVRTAWRYRNVIIIIDVSSGYVVV